MTQGFLTQFCDYKLPTKRKKVGPHCPLQPGKSGSCTAQQVCPKESRGTRLSETHQLTP